jgi:hypothetical protein
VVERLFPALVVAHAPGEGLPSGARRTRTTPAASSMRNAAYSIAAISGLSMRTPSSVLMCAERPSRLSEPT